MAKKNILEQEKNCFFCLNNHITIDYKDVNTIRRFLSSYNKIVPRRRSGVCSLHQRKLATAVKRGRFMALLPYTNL